MLLGRVGAQMVSLVLVLFVLERYGSPALAGTTTFLALAPGLLASPIAGTMLDRFGRTRLIVLDYAFAAAAIGTIVALSLSGLLAVPVFLAIVTAASLTYPLSSVGMRTLFPILVPRHLWERANAVDSNGYAAAAVLAPALAGAIVGAYHGEGGLVAAAAVYVAAAAVTTGVRDPQIRGAATGSFLRAAWAGVVHVVQHPTLRGIAVGVSIANVAHGIFFIALPVIVLTRLGGSPALVGQLLALEGVAAFVSVALVGRMRTEGRERRLMGWSAAAGAVAMTAVLLRVDLASLVFAVVVIGIANGPYDVAMFTLRQRRVDPAWLGRAFAVSMSLNFIGFPVGSALGGALAAVSAEAALAVAVGFAAVSVVLTFRLLPRA